MPHRTDIEWTDYSSNPLIAELLLPDGTVKRGWSCEMTSPGCAHCYSKAVNGRFGTGLNYNAADNARVRHVLSEKELAHILTFRPRGPYRGGTEKPKVFPFDMTDLFGEWVPDETIDVVMGTFAKRPDVIFQVLTKRAERMCKYIHRWLALQDGTESPRGTVKPLANVQLGVSAEDQPRADERIPWLLKTPAAVRFLSCEPLIGPIFLPTVHSFTPEGDEIVKRLPKVDWVIVGGESGSGARPCDVAWIRSIVGQCQAAGVACFVKQLGSRWITREVADDEPLPIHGTRHPKGGDIAEFPDDLKVRQFPCGNQ